MKFIDVSVPISEDTLHWYSEPKIEFVPIKEISKGESANVTLIKMSLHSGTHIDAPLHFINNGKDFSEYDISLFNGKAKVLEINNNEKITLSDIENFSIDKNDIIFFKTNNSKNEWYKEKFNNEFIFLTIEAAEFLVNRKIKCVGIDYLSIAEKGKGEAVHKILLSNGIGLIEGLYLGKVEQGEYEVICLPLKIVGAEAAPARVVLKKLSE